MSKPHGMTCVYRILGPLPEILPSDATPGLHFYKSFKTALEADNWDELACHLHPDFEFLGDVQHFLKHNANQANQLCAPSHLSKCSGIIVLSDFKDDNDSTKRMLIYDRKHIHVSADGLNAEQVESQKLRIHLQRIPISETRCISDGWLLAKLEYDRIHCDGECLDRSVPPNGSDNNTNTSTNRTQQDTADSNQIQDAKEEPEQAQDQTSQAELMGNVKGQNLFGTGKGVASDEVLRTASQFPNQTEEQKTGDLEEDLFALVDSGASFDTIHQPKALQLARLLDLQIKHGQIRLRGLCIEGRRFHQNLPFTSINLQPYRKLMSIYWDSIHREMSRMFLNKQPIRTESRNEPLGQRKESRKERKRREKKERRALERIREGEGGQGEAPSSSRDDSDAKVKNERSKENSAYDGVAETESKMQESRQIISNGGVNQKKKPNPQPTDSLVSESIATSVGPADVAPQRAEEKVALQVAPTTQEAQGLVRRQIQENHEYIISLLSSGKFANVPVSKQGRNLHKKLVTVLTMKLHKRGDARIREIVDTIPPEQRFKKICERLDQIRGDEYFAALMTDILNSDEMKGTLKSKRMQDAPGFPQKKLQRPHQLVEEPVPDAFIKSEEEIRQNGPLSPERKVILDALDRLVQKLIERGDEEMRICLKLPDEERIEAIERLLRDTRILDSYIGGLCSEVVNDFRAAGRAIYTPQKMAKGTFEYLAKHRKGNAAYERLIFTLAAKLRNRGLATSEKRKYIAEKTPDQEIVGKTPVQESARESDEDYTLRVSLEFEVARLKHHFVDLLRDSLVAVKRTLSEGSDKKTAFCPGQQDYSLTGLEDLPADFSKSEPFTLRAANLEATDPEALVECHDVLSAFLFEEGDCEFVCGLGRISAQTLGMLASKVVQLVRDISTDLHKVVDLEDLGKVLRWVSQQPADKIDKEAAKTLGTELSLQTQDQIEQEPKYGANPSAKKDDGIVHDAKEATSEAKKELPKTLAADATDLSANVQSVPAVNEPVGSEGCMQEAFSRPVEDSTLKGGANQPSEETVQEPDSGHIEGSVQGSDNKTAEEPVEGAVHELAETSGEAFNEPANSLVEETVVEPANGTNKSPSVGTNEEHYNSTEEETIVQEESKDQDSTNEAGSSWQNDPLDNSVASDHHETVVRLRTGYHAYIVEAARASRNLIEDNDTPTDWPNQILQSYTSIFPFLRTFDRNYPFPRYWVFAHDKERARVRAKSTIANFGENGYSGLLYHIALDATYAHARRTIHFGDMEPWSDYQFIPEHTRDVEIWEYRHLLAQAEWSGYTGISQEEGLDIVVLPMD